jgi:hypothetical protein
MPTKTAVQWLKRIDESDDGALEKRLQWCEGEEETVSTGKP